MNIPDHDWQTLKRECLQGGSIYDTLLQVARRVPPGLRDYNAQNTTSWEVDPHADFTDVKLEPTIKTYKIQFTKQYGEVINAFQLIRKEYPDDATLHALACKVTRKMKLTKKSDNDKENLTIPKEIWDHLEPHI